MTVWFNIYFQSSLSWTTVITNWALVWVQVIMNWFRMLFQITFCITNIITNWALIWLFVLMNWFHIFKLAFWEKLKLQIEHLNDFLLSWTFTICIFKLPFLRTTEITNWTLLKLLVIMNWFSMLFKSHFQGQT